MGQVSDLIGAQGAAAAGVRTGRFLFSTAPNRRHLRVGAFLVRGRASGDAGAKLAASSRALDMRDSRAHNYPPRWNAALLPPACPIADISCRAH
jgi:hypothetical protein